MNRPSNNTALVVASLAIVALLFASISMVFLENQPREHILPPIIVAPTTADSLLQQSAAPAKSDTLLPPTELQSMYR